MVVQIYDLVVSDLVLVVGFVFGFSSSAFRPLDFDSTRIDYPYLWFRIWLFFFPFELVCTRSLCRWRLLIDGGLGLEVSNR